jgi:S1-C subfamily serine protease
MRRCAVLAIGFVLACSGPRGPATEASRSARPSQPGRPAPGEATVRTIPNGSRTSVLYSATPRDAHRETLDLICVADERTVRGEAGKEIVIVWSSERIVSGTASIEFDGENLHVELPSRVVKEASRFVVSAQMSAHALAESLKLGTPPRFVIDDRSFRLSSAQTKQLARFLALLPRGPDGRIATQPGSVRQRPVASGPARERKPNPQEARTPESRARLRGFGTCFAVSPSGLLVTNNHVVAGADEIVVEFTKGRAHRARIRAASMRHDLAILSISAKPPALLPVASARRLLRGDGVFTFGFPVPHLLGWELRYTDGTISALSVRNDSSMIQTSIPIQPGNSGGPLVTDEGIVVGIITSKLKAAAFAGTGTVPESIAFARKADPLIRLLGGAPSGRRARSRSEALRRAERATCRVYTYGRR